MINRFPLSKQEYSTLLPEGAQNLTAPSFQLDSPLEIDTLSLCTRHQIPIAAFFHRQKPAKGQGMHQRAQVPQSDAVQVTMTPWRRLCSALFSHYSSQVPSMARCSSGTLQHSHCVVHAVTQRYDPQAQGILY